MASASASPALNAPSHGDWIRSPSWDVFWMFSALWGGALLLLGTGLVGLALAAVGIFALQRAVSTWHAWSTTWMVVGSSLLAEERRARPVKYLGIPLFIAATAMALGFAVALGQRYPADGHFGPELWIWGLYLSLFWVGHFWHFGNQDFGVLTIYRTRAGQNRWIDRRVDKLYTVAMMFVIQPVVYVGLIGSTAFAEMLRTALPAAPSVLADAATAAVIAAALLTAGMLAHEVSKPTRSLPKLLYIVVIFLHPTLLYAASRAGSETLALLYVIAYLWSHWLIAIGLVGRINAHYYRSRGDTPGFALLRHLAILSGLVGVVLVLTYPYADYLLFNLTGFAYKERLAAIAHADRWIVGGVMGFFLAEQLVHYYCDRCLFRFRDPAIRRKVGTLLFGEAP